MCRLKLYSSQECLQSCQKTVFILLHCVDNFADNYDVNPSIRLYHNCMKEIITST